MRTIINHIIMYMCAASIVLPSPLAAASRLSPGQPAIAVVPIYDGELDDISSEITGKIENSLKLNGQYRVIESDLTARVLEYNEGSKDASNPTVDEAKRAIARAKELYFAFRNKEAEQELTRGVMLLNKGREETGDSGGIIAEAHLVLAIISKSKGDSNGMRESIVKALRINPFLELDGAEYPPSLIAALEGARRDLKAGPLSTVQIKSKPEAAEVFLNGVRRGVTPLEISGLPTGHYRIGIRANKYEGIDRTVELKNGEGIQINERLHWAKGGKGQGKTTTMQNTAAEIREGLKIANVLKADKVVLINAASASNKGGKILARMVDRRLGVGQRPLEAALIKDSTIAPQELDLLSNGLIAQARADVLASPQKHIDPAVIGDPVILNKRKKPLHRNPIFWGIVGTLVAGALGGGLFAAFSSGGSNDKGSVRVNFLGEDKK